MAKDTQEIDSADVGTLANREFTDDDFRSIKTIEDAIKLVGTLTDVKDVLGTGFEILNEKDRLVSTPFVIVTWVAHEGDFGIFATAYVVTEDGDRWILNDGSTGIMTQLLSLRDSLGITEGIAVRGGLRRSDYTYEAPDGTQKPAVTYYLAT